MEQLTEKKNSTISIIVFNLSILGALFAAYTNYFFDHTYDPGFAFFFLISLSVIFSGQISGLIVGLVSISVWLASDLLGSNVDPTPLITVVNALSRGLSLTLVYFLSIIIRRTVRQKKEMELLDSFTGLLSRDGFQRIGNSEFARHRRYERPLSIASIDITNLRKVNEDMGYGMGDLLIQSTARVIKKHVRKSDIVSRASGDEFLLLFPKTDEHVITIIEKIKHKLVQTAEKDKMPVGFVFGVITYDEVPESLEQSIKASVALMEKAKENEKNRIEHEIKRKES